MARKKILQSVDAGPAEPEEKPIAQQTHRIVTTYKKAIPLEEAEAELEPEDQEEEPELIEPEPPAMTEPAYSDPISQMLDDLQIERRSHSWTMIIERLPNYEKDGRHDVQSKRVNCGTRPMSTDFVEDIRREFARPGKPNHFRLTIKRDNRIFAHWPEVISLEPPPLEEIAEYEAKTQTLPPVYNFTTPQQPSFKQMLDQFKQLAELKSVLFPELAANPAPLPRPEPLTEEAALMKLITSNDDVIDRFSKQISKRLFREDAADAETSWLVILKSALDNGPGIVRELFAGIARLKTDINGQPIEPAAAPAPPPVNQSQEIAPPSPEIVLLSRVLQLCEMRAPADAAARWVDQYTEQTPAVAPLVEMFLAMTPQESINFLNQYFPQTAHITAAEHAPEWIAALQGALTKGDEGEEGA